MYLASLWIKLQETDQCRFEKPTFTTSPSTDKLSWAFKYIYILDEQQAAFHSLWKHIITHCILWAFIIT